jgi:hypothetical protein
VFADSFTKTYYDSYAETEINQSVLELFKDMHKRHVPNNYDTSVDDITVELVNKNIRFLKLGKTSGSDNSAFYIKR